LQQRSYHNCYSPFIYCQDIAVNGIVLDPYQHVLSGVSVKVKGQSSGAVTDSNGYYKLMAPAKGKLTFSRKGYLTQKALVLGDTSINILLEYDPDRAADREVNTGFGTVKESQNTQATSSVDKKLIQQNNGTDIIQLFESVPGVKVVNSGGELKILIRGIRSMTSDNFALIVLNGSVYLGSLRDLNKNDIKSIDILKDGSGYGSRGANGVVLITTK
jgi:TonB-dependent SusC/RagA subfamily outer membrane receptor